MRVLLVNPYYPVSETPSPPLGLACLAGALESAGIQVRILDCVVFPYSKPSLESVMNAFRPHLIGLTAVTMNVDNALAVARDAKAVTSDIPIVMGGPHVSFYARKTLQDHPEVDVIVRGEGDETIVELTRAVQKGAGLSHIKGLVFREKARIVDTGPRPFIADIDALPEPARHLIPMGRYRALGLPVSITTSRGCPFHCIFCVGRKMVGAKVRYRHPRRVVDELARLSALDFHQINLADDLFTASRQHCLAVCDEIIQRGLTLRWTSFARVDTISLELMQRMKQAGCTAVSFGIESGSPEILKRIRKGITLDQVFAAVHMCTQAGITPQASFILGLPGETPETLQATLDLGARLKDLGVMHGYHLLAPFPGTDIRENIQAYDLQIMSQDWKEYHANRAIVRTAGVNRRMMDEIVMDWEHQFNLWLGDIKRRRESGEATPEEAWPLTNLEHTVLLYELMMHSIIEEQGRFPCERSALAPSAAVAELVNRIDGSVDQTREQLGQTLNHAVERGYLTHENQDGHCRWKWIDYL